MAKRKNKLSYSPEVIRTMIVGVTFDNDDGSSRQKYISTLQKGQSLSLVRDPDNEYDEDAITICTVGKIFRGAKQLGFLAAYYADFYAPLLDAGGRIDVEVESIVGGGGWLWWKAAYGVYIRMTVYGYTE